MAETTLAGKFRTILNIIKDKHNMLTDDSQNALKNEVFNYIQLNPYYGPHVLQRRILDPKYIYEDDTPYFHAFIASFDPINWFIVRMSIDYLLEPEKIVKQVNEL